MLAPVETTADSTCAFCGPCETKTFALLCGRCSSVKYCSKDCQRKHWKAGHKQECDDLMRKSIEFEHAEKLAALEATHEAELQVTIEFARHK